MLIHGNICLAMFVECEKDKLFGVLPLRFTKYEQGFPTKVAKYSEVLPS